MNFFAVTFAKARPYTGPLPSATPPKEVAVFALVTGVNHRVAAFGYRGGSFFDRREFSMAGTLVRHPRGDLLIDTGFDRHIDEQFATLPLIFRAITSYSLWQPAADQLKAAIRPEIAARHSSDPCTLGSRQRPARLSRRGRMGDAAGARIHQEGRQRTIRQTSSGIRYEEYGFEGGPYLGFPQSHDVYSDGSIIVVPAPGHSPGSVIIFVTCYDGARYALVGDLV